MTSKALRDATGGEESRNARSAVQQLVCTTTRLTCDGVPVQAHGIDLIAAAGEDGLLFQHEDFGLSGRGVALRFDLPAGLEDAQDVAEVSRVLQAIPGTNEMSVSGAGAVALGALAFDRGAAGRLTLPAVVIGRRGRDAWLSVTSAPEDVAAANRLAEEMLSSALAGASAKYPDEPSAFALSSVPGPAEWSGLVADAVERIGAGDFDKVVLARQVTVIADSPFVKAVVLNRLAARFPACMVFQVEGFLGASPELLVERRGLSIASTPLAGTVGRTGDAAMDRLQIEALRSSDKERAEHGFVVEDLQKSLAPLCRRLHVPEEPSVLELRNVCHLLTQITGELHAARSGRPQAPEEGRAALRPSRGECDVAVGLSGVPSALELVAVVHPSAAVGGAPLPEAIAYIKDVEGFNRGTFAGPVGWMDWRGDGCFAIGLRSADVTGNRAVLYAGAGVVADSQPRDELEETRLKLQAMLAALVRP